MRVVNQQNHWTVININPRWILFCSVLFFHVFLLFFSSFYWCIENQFQLPLLPPSLLSQQQRAKKNTTFISTLWISAENKNTKTKTIMMMMGMFDRRRREKNNTHKQTQILKNSSIFFHSKSRVEAEDEQKKIEN